MINKIRLRVHDRVRSEDLKHEFVVDALIHSGTGQGDIYKVHEGKDVYALKLYHTGDPKRHRRQIDILYKRGRASSSFVHPLFTVKVGEQIGYVMEYVGGDHYKSGSVLFNGLERDADGGNTIRMELPFCQKLEILYNYLNAAAILYDADIIYGDYKPDNCKVNMNDYSVKILDTDTAVGAASRPIVCGTIGFVEPLVMRGEIVPNKHSDAFALAVIIYMTLISGHPLRGKRYEEPCNTDIDTYTFATNPIYVYSNLDHSNRPLPDDKRVIERMKAYPQYFRDAMHRTFVDGLFDGEKRTSPREWMEILTQLYRDHFICKHCGEEHFFGTVARNCHVCGTSLEPPIKLVCDNAPRSGVHLFNGMDIYTEDLFPTANNYRLFGVVVSEYDKKYGLLCVGPGTVTVELQDGAKREFERGDVIPIFMDATLKVGNNVLEFIGGRVK